MFRKIIIISILLITTVVLGQSVKPTLLKEKDFFSNFKNLTLQQILDTAKYYNNKNSIDTALFCYSLIINLTEKGINNEQQLKHIDAHFHVGNLYSRISDYSNSYDFYIKALSLSEKYNIDTLNFKIYNNIGNIYSRFGKFDVAKTYYKNALEVCPDSSAIVAMLSNLGKIEIETKNIDSAFHILNKALQISKRQNDSFLHTILNNIASIYHEKKYYDSAFYCLRLALEAAKRGNQIEYEADNLTGLGKLFLEINKIDSAFHYINISNKIAKENNLFGILTKNYLVLSQIEESKKNIGGAFEYYKTYSNLKDSVFNVEKFGEINQLQRFYEISKTNRQIEELTFENKIKERTIYYQRIIRYIISVVLLLVIIGFLHIYLQKKKLNKAYRALVEKNLEIIKISDKSSKKQEKKSKKRSLSQNVYEEIVSKILNVMKDTEIICDPNFSINRLADILQSNYTYVSESINFVLKKNFSTILNEFRINEAQRLFSNPDTKKYTVDFVGEKVGYNSRSSFYRAFKEITGVTPSFYMKSIHENEG